MYLATAAFGCLLIIIGCLMPHKSENAEQSITQKTENKKQKDKGKTVVHEESPKSQTLDMNELLRKKRDRS